MPLVDFFKPGQVTDLNTGGGTIAGQAGGVSGGVGLGLPPGATLDEILKTARGSPDGIGTFFTLPVLGQVRDLNTGMLGAGLGVAVEELSKALAPKTPISPSGGDKTPGGPSGGGSGDTPINDLIPGLPQIPDSGSPALPPVPGLPPLPTPGTPPSLPGLNPPATMPSPDGNGARIRVQDSIARRAGRKNTFLTTVRPVRPRTIPNAPRRMDYRRTQG